jgi:hypothetical protein
MIDAIGSRIHAVVSFFYEFYFISELPLSNCFLLCIDRYAGKLDSEGKDVGFARSLWTVRIVLFRTHGLMRGG